jgi:L-serine kinase (ATP) / ParB family transcriptional regulator, heme-responsive regulator
VAVTEPFDLRVVPVDAVVPHEEAEPHRVERLMARLEADGRLANPPIVGAAAERFVLLDGANRIAALRQLGFEHVIVQVTAADRLRLDTWYHVVVDIDPDRLLRAVGEVNAVRLDGGGGVPMCTLRLVDGRSFAVSPAPGLHPFAALNPLVAAYLAVARIARTTEAEAGAAIADRPDAAALVEFPRLTVDTVFAAARAGHRLPAGITRFIVAGRVIALNAPLAPLRARRPLDDHNAWLDDLIAERRAGGRIRHYPEAVYVLDD